MAAWVGQWRRRAGRAVRWAVLALTVCLALLAAAVGLGTWGLMRWPPAAGDTAPVEVVVPHGATGAQVAAIMERAGVLRARWLLRLHLATHRSLALRAGAHMVHRGMDVPALAEALAHNPPQKQAPFTVRPGDRVADVDAALARAGLAPAGAYMAAAAAPGAFRLAFPTPGHLEGYLAADTWQLATDAPVDLQALMQRQLDLFTRRFVEPNAAALAASGRSLQQVVTMASMLEREARISAQRPQVAGILYRRLDAGIPLGVDATSRYPLPDWADERGLRAALTRADDPYNTRLRKGLPPTALCALSTDAFGAALHPMPTRALYYLHDAQGLMHTARNAAEHEANRARYGVY